MFQQILVLAFVTVASASAFAESSATVGVSLTPAGDFTIKNLKVTGDAYKTSDGGVAAENIVIDLKDLKTAIALRDTHTKRYMKVAEFPTAKLIKATGKDGKGKGEAEIMGKKVPIQGTYKVEGKQLKAQFKVHIADVGIKNVNYMGTGVDDDVMVDVSVPLRDKK
jgi:hypothetical protein